MAKELRYAVFETDMGWGSVLGSTRGLLRTTVCHSSRAEALKLLGDQVNNAVLDPGVFESLAHRFREYFEGNKVSFPGKLDLSGATAFQRQVWEAARLIPFGETRSYGWIAEQIDNPGAARAVGQAMARNRLAIIIPCHRVIASDGKLGGFGSRPEMKRYLLNLEAMASVQ